MDRSRKEGCTAVDSCRHGQINYKETKTKCRLYMCFIEFIDWRYSQTCWYFRPSFVSHCPSNLLYGTPPPTSPFSKSKYSIYRQCVSGRGGGGCWVVLETTFCRSLTLSIWPDSGPTKLPYHPKQKPTRGGRINTCRKVPLQVIFLDYDIWHCFPLV